MTPLHIAGKPQQFAAHPHHSVWVAASAGSGKTKVLTDRVLNLLLEGCAPERILCLTFTKAAAAEMANRVRVRLGEWAILSEKDLHHSLETLQGFPPSPEKLHYARTLFGLTLDTPGGLKIQTIHSFCQSLLKRFPLEAGLSPFFEVMNETAQRMLLKTASHHVMGAPDFQELSLHFSEQTLGELNEFILQMRTGFEAIFSSVPPSKPQPKDALLITLLTQIPSESLKQGLSLFEEGSTTDQKRGRDLAYFLSLSPEAKQQNYEDYLSFFLTQKGEKRSCLLTQKLALKSPAFKDLLEGEAHRLEQWLIAYHTAEIAGISQALSNYGQALLTAYESLKTAQSVLDYEDLIQKSAVLLKNPGCHWVLYKLDGGLDHILVDEAQDTSPSQWQVIRAIAEEFYANSMDDPRNRTLFIVGDGKQSIYSFQGADPAIFTQMQQDLSTFARNSGQSWKDIDLTVSFRSTPEVLELVDSIFSIHPLFPQPLAHLPFRKDSRGHVEVWPLIEKEKDESCESWSSPLTQNYPSSPQKRLAYLIATTIKKWISGTSPLSRSICPGDILILVRRRTSFADILIRALKEKDVPVAGIDRLWLLESLAVQDLLEIGEFLLLPEDDLTLATVLKGPLCCLNDDDLFKLAYGRGEKSLWRQLRNDPAYRAVTTTLADLLARVDFLTPFALFSYILGPLGGKKKWQSRLGPECADSIDEFLNLCLTFQEKQTPSLQGFLHWVSQEIIELKRDLDQSNQVRIMTVHGSKGLQAPIVFLPDTTHLPNDFPPFLIHEGSLVWLPPASKDIPLTKELKQKFRKTQQEEYNRLLYVALTRAEDALYICGWESNSQGTWYDLVTEGMEKVGEPVDFDSPEGLRGKGWQFSSIPKGKTSPIVPEKKPVFLSPSWLTTPPPLEESPHIVRPSDDHEEERVFGISEWGAFGTERGILIHKLLETLPAIPKESRLSLALSYLEKKQIPSPIALEMAESVLRVFETFPDFFGPRSQGEVPLIGKVGNVILSGQIDRLIMGEDHILCIDFKTHTHVPEGLAQIPQNYVSQMALYQLALSQIYPQYSILCGLLWTQLPRLDVLPDSLLKKYSPSIDEKTGKLYTGKN